MRSKTQTSSKDTKEKAGSVGGSRSRNRGYDSEDEIEIKDYEDETNRTEIELEKGHKSRRKGRRKG